MRLSNFDTVYKILSGEVNNKMRDQSKQKYSEKAN